MGFDTSQTCKTRPDKCLRLSFRGAANGNDNKRHDAKGTERQASFAEKHECAIPPWKICFSEAYLGHAVEHRCDGDNEGERECDRDGQPRNKKATLLRIWGCWNGWRPPWGSLHSPFARARRMEHPATSPNWRLKAGRPVSTPIARRDSQHSLTQDCCEAYKRGHGADFTTLSYRRGSPLVE
jgi:hypothetical protein